MGKLDVILTSVVLIGTAGFVVSVLRKGDDSFLYRLALVVAGRETGWYLVGFDKGPESLFENIF